jgi:hypothetical protein
MQLFEKEIVVDNKKNNYFLKINCYLCKLL